MELFITIFRSAVIGSIATEVARKTINYYLRRRMMEQHMPKLLKKLINFRDRSILSRAARILGQGDEYDDYFVIALKAHSYQITPYRIALGEKYEVVQRKTVKMETVAVVQEVNK